jgi:hypothetical protein
MRFYRREERWCKLRTRTGIGSKSAPPNGGAARGHSIAKYARSGANVVSPGDSCWPAGGIICSMCDMLRRWSSPPGATIALILSLAAASAGAQENLLPSTAWGLSPVISVWRFATPLATAKGAIKDVAQAAVPFQVRRAIGRWTFDVTGAYATAAVHTASSGQEEDDEGVTLLSGPSDLKLRMSGPVVSNNVLITAGLNIPTGTARLNGDQTSVLQAVGAPALHMPIASYGVGTGGTLGLIGAVETAGWALALGASVEQRTEYTPIALALSGGSSETRLKPGTAAHVTLGADRPLGEFRLSVVVLGDVYASDNVVIATPGFDPVSTQYRLGPQLAAMTRLEFGGGAWSEGALTVSARHRTAFTEAEGREVSGSSGNYFEGSLGGVLGGANHPGLVIGVDGRWHSGLPFTSALVGAAVTAGGATLGIHFPGGVRLTVHPQYGSFDTGVTKTTGVGATIALSIFARGAQ